MRAPVFLTYLKITHSNSKKKIENLFKTQLLRDLLSEKKCIAK